MIVFKNVSKIYESKQTHFHALKDINLEVFDDEILGVVGHSGAGKSTLIRLVNDLIKPTSGHIYIDDVSINHLKRKDLIRMRRTIGMVFQSFNLLQQFTVYQNVELALNIADYPKEKRHDRILEVLSLVGLLDKKDSYPKALSGGQKQRVGIARAIVNEPKYLLCDEITSALDQKTAYEIIDVLKKIKKQTHVTIMFISHQLDVVRKLCDRIAVMHAGEIVETLTTKALFVAPQHELTKVLVDSMLEFDTSKANHVYRLVYSSATLNQTVLSDVIKQFDINTNIIHAKSIDLKDEVIGYLWIEITGAHTLEAVDALRAQEIEVTELGCI